MSNTLSHFELFKRIVKHKTSLLLFAFIGVYGLMAYDKFESTVNPVVTNFSIGDAWFQHGSLFLVGTMDKLRDCDFKGAVAYDMSGAIPKLVSLEYLESPNGEVSRDTGLQLFGPWQLTPKTSTLKIIGRHQCTTGSVSTVLFKGVLVEVPVRE